MSTVKQTVLIQHPKVAFPNAKLKKKKKSTGYRTHTLSSHPFL